MGWFGDQLKGAAGGAVSGIAGGITSGALGLLGNIGAKRREQRQIENQQKLNEQAAELNYKYGEMSAEQAFKRQMELYERTQEDNSIGAKKRQMEEEGLSVGLLMSQGLGNSGGAGQATTAPQGSGAGNQQAGQAANAAERQLANQQGAMVALQAAKVQSEIKLNEAAANEKNADAKKTGGVDTDLAKTNIKEALERINNYKVQRTGQEIQNRINTINEEIKSATKEFEIESIQFIADKLHYEIEILMEEMDQAATETDIKNETKETVIATVKQQLKNLAIEAVQKTADIGLKGATKTLTERQTLEIGQLIDLKLNGQRLDQLELARKIQEMGIGISNKQADRLAGFINAILGGGAIGAISKMK